MLSKLSEKGTFSPDNLNMLNYDIFIVIEPTAKTRALF